MLASHGIEPIDYEGYKRLDAYERRLGAREGRTRVKVVAADDMEAIARGAVPDGAVPDGAADVSAAPGSRGSATVAVPEGTRTAGAGRRS